MKIRAADFDNLTPGAMQAILAVLNAHPEAPLDLRQRQHKTLEFTVAAQRRLARKRSKELQATAHVVKKGDWGLAEVVAEVVFQQAGPGGPPMPLRKPKPRWARGPGKRWPLEDAERYAKLFGGTVQR
jgi:hypothetical protein